MDQITKRICDRSDLELRKKLAASLAWIWIETGYDSPRPKPEQLEEVNEVIRGTGLEPYKEIPWIGAASKVFEAVTFAYLRDKYRDKAVADFIEKVEAIKDVAF